MQTGRLTRKEIYQLLPESKIIALFYDADHGFSGVHDDFVTGIIVIPGSAVIAGFLPVYMDALAVGEVPAVHGDVMNLECKVALTDFLVGNILD